MAGHRLSRVQRRFRLLARSLLVVALASLSLGTPVGARAAETDQDAATREFADGFIKGFVTGFERTANVRLPRKEAVCVTDKFLARVTPKSLIGIKSAAAMTPAQKSAIVEALANCLSTATYREVLENRLQTKSAPLSVQECVAVNALDRLSVAQMIRYDYATYLGTTGNKAVGTTLESVVATCALRQRAGSPKAGAGKSTGQ